MSSIELSIHFVLGAGNKNNNNFLCPQELIFQRQRQRNKPVINQRVKLLIKDKKLRIFFKVLPFKILLN